jgi:lipopolysaccharide transport system permease protein
MALADLLPGHRLRRDAFWDDELTVILPTRGWRAFDLAELVRRAELLRFLIWRDLKVRYQQTLLGGLWAILQPLATAAAFTLVFRRLARMPSDGIPYPLFSLTALVVWTFFAGALNGAVTSLVGNRQLISKVYFPRLILPLSAALGGLVDLAIGLACLVAGLLLFGLPVSWTAVWVLPLTLIALATATGLGAGLGAINVRFRDVRALMPLLVQLWLFLTPVAYPASLAPARWRPLLGLNPMSGVVEGYRWALLRAGPAPVELIAVSTLSALVLLVVGLVVFRKMEGFFADII